MYFFLRISADKRQVQILHVVFYGTQLSQLRNIIVHILSEKQ